MDTHSAARIPGAPPTGFFRKIVYWLTRRKVGRVVMPVQVMAHHSRLLFAYGTMEDSIQSSQRVSPALKALASVRVSTLAGCPF